MHFAMKHKTCENITLIIHQRKDRLTDELLFYVPLKNFSLIWRRHHFRACLPAQMWQSITHYLPHIFAILCNHQPNMGTQSCQSCWNFPEVIRVANYENKRPMGHIVHLSNLGPYRNIICISFPPFNPRGPMILINLPLFYVRKLSCKIQLFLAS
jgi:hypothetical protein